MHPDEYIRMYQTEEELWWYRGLRGFLHSQIKAIGLPGECRVLDVGCGTGINLKLLQKFGHATGIDFAPEAVEFCRQRGLQSIARASVFQLPFPDGHFDLVTCMDVLGHSWITDDVEAVAELRRVTRPGGYVIMHVAALEALRGQHDEVIMFSRRYSRKQLETTVAAGGLHIKRMTFRNFAFMPLLLVHRTASRFRRSAQSEAESDVKLPHPAVNNIMTFVANLENQVAKHLPLPIGSSLFCLAQRPINNMQEQEIT